MVYCGFMFGQCFVIHYFVSSHLCNHFDGEESAGCFVLTVFLMYCDSQRSVSLPHIALVWSAVSDCGIS